jgi:hypothetical protein
LEKLKNRGLIKIIKENLNFKIINCIPEVNDDTKNAIFDISNYNDLKPSRMID